MKTEKEALKQAETIHFRAAAAESAVNAEASKIKIIELI